MEHSNNSIGLPRIAHNANYHPTFWWLPIYQNLFSYLWTSYSIEKILEKCNHRKEYPTQFKCFYFVFPLITICNIWRDTAPWIVVAFMSYPVSPIVGERSQSGCRKQLPITEAVSIGKSLRVSRGSYSSSETTTRTRKSCHRALNSSSQTDSLLIFSSARKIMETKNWINIFKEPEKYPLLLPNHDRLLHQQHALVIISSRQFFPY